MGILLKQALKSICDANRWSYAVFWKAGVQNPKLLIWEECYYEVMSSSDTDNGNKQLTLEELDMCWLTPGSGHGVQLKDKVQLLVNKMMMANQVHVIGEGLVGRTAFAGNHQWIISGNYNGHGYPPEVINELNVQFSAGMQTIAVIPVIPLGVVQLGSSLPIMENIEFIQNLKDLILQLDQVPTAFLPNFLATGEYSNYIGTPINEMASVLTDTDAMFGGGINSYKNPRFANDLSHTVLGEVGNNLQVNAPVFESTHYVSRSQGNRSQESLEKATINSHIPPSRDIRTKHGGAEVIPVTSDTVRNQQPCLFRSGYRCSYGQSADRNYNQNQRVLVPLQGSGVDQSSSSCVSVMTSQLNENELQYSDRSDCWKVAAGTELQTGSYCDKMVDDDDVIKQPINNVVSIPSYSGKRAKPGKQEATKLSNIGSAWPSCEPIPDFNTFCGTKQYTQCTNDVLEDNLNQCLGGDDLFDIVGMEIKNKTIQGYACDFDGNVGGSQMDELKKDKLEGLPSLVSTKDDWFSESCIFSSSASDHLLEAVVSGIHHDSTQSATDGNLSCLTRADSSVLISSPKFDTVKTMLNSTYELSGNTEPVPSSIETGPSLIKSGFGKERAGNIFHMSSSYGSHSSSWVEQGPVVKHESSSIATANSRKSAALLPTKPNRKRLKAGESPRPRPKDRQMIQDRVKELREIIPNGAKCSIDALLERTIKHMLFLQSVTKHGDKLKHITDSKTFEDDRILVKDKFERGATWAYEVGSEAMVCPIVVEDLNPPRQLLVKMLCEEKGSFLELADMIRGMGLTILKGVMESRNDKVWARFAVEADRDVTRMEVFMSLVHLLEQAGKDNNAPVEDNDKSVSLDQIAASMATPNRKQQLVSSKSQVMC